MEQQSTIVKPGDPIKANLSFDDVKKIALELYAINVVSIKELNGYDDKNYKLTDEYGGSVVLKIINLIDSQKSEIYEAQSLLLVHLGNHGITCPVPITTKTGSFFKKYKLQTGEHIVRALKFIDGNILAEVPWTTNLFYEIGEAAALMNKAMKSFKHSAYTNYKSLWMLESVPDTLQFLSAVKDQERRKLVTTIVEEFKQRVLLSTQHFEGGLIHGDFNEQNIIVDKNNANFYQIKAIIDYGDCHVGSYLYELAITMTYVMLLAKDIQVGGYIIAGYSSVRQVTEEEYALIKLCIAARLCQSLILGAYTHQQDATNTYALTTAAYGWQLLEKVWSESDEEIIKVWKNVVNI